MEPILRADTTWVSLYHSLGKLRARAADVKSNIPQPWFDIFSGLISVRIHNNPFLTFLSYQIRSSTWQMQKQKQKPQSQRRTIPTNVQTTEQLCSFHMLARLCSQSFKRGFSSMWTENSQTNKLGLEKAEEPEIKLPTLLDHEESQRIPEKHLLLINWLW